jgi:hypothetical protein
MCQTPPASASTSSQALNSGNWNSTTITIAGNNNTETALLWWGNSECAEYEHSASQQTFQNDIMSHPTALNTVIARAVDGSKFDLDPL